MDRWLRALSVAFVVSSVSVGGYVLLKGGSAERLSAEAERLRPVIDEAVGQGQLALQTLFETSRPAPATPTQTAAAPAQPAPAADAPAGPQPGQAPTDPASAKPGKLPFMVIEPKDFAAPAMAHPSPVAPKADEGSDIRLTQREGQMPVDLSPVEARLRARVPKEVLDHFDLFLYVSKATPDKGSWAQRMFVLAKTEGHVFELRHNWLVSTGKEEKVVSPAGKLLGTHTPEGVFKLDRYRSFEDYTSRQWKSPMPYAIFFDWQIEGRVSGLAIHGSDAKGEAELGNRASHGCIRLATDNARTLFETITSRYKGRVPKFKVDPATGTMSTKGALMRDENGEIVMTPGYKVLVFIEDYGGPSNDQIAALF